MDGVKAPVIRANYAFMAVPVAQGNHTVRFEFAPNSFRVGRHPQRFRGTADHRKLRGTAGIALRPVSTAAFVVVIFVVIDGPKEQQNVELLAHVDVFFERRGHRFRVRPVSPDFAGIFDQKLING